MHKEAREELRVRFKLVVLEQALFWLLDWGRNNLSLLRFKDSIKSFGGLLVIIPDQAAKVSSGLLKLPHKLSSLLRHPQAIWMLSDHSQMNSLAAQLDKEQHANPLYKDCFASEEIASQQLVFVMIHHTTTPIIGAIIVFAPYKLDLHLIICFNVLAIRQILGTASNR